MHGIFDSHAHYNDSSYNDDLEQVINHIKLNGVDGVINVGCDIKSSMETILLTKKYDIFYGAVGIHPHEASKAPSDYINKLKIMAKEDKVIAIGEIGLDYHYAFSPINSQKEVFKMQLELANSLNLPVIIHSREATQDMSLILNEYRPKGVVHCFTGSVETANEIVSLGLYIGLTGVVTFNNARKILDVIKAIDMDKILLETDCPYMAPVPFRGKRTTSDMIIYNAKVISDIKGYSVQEVIDIARSNTKKLFNIV